MKLNKWFFVSLLVLGLLFGAVLWGQTASKGWWNGVDDYRLMWLSDGKISLISVSPRRGLINELVVNPETKIWIPGGLGWYEAGKIYRLMTTENRRQDIEKVAFFNFGFWPDATWWAATNGGWNDLSVWLNSGWLNGVRLKWVSDRLLLRSENLLESEKEIQLGRNMSDSSWLENESKLTVINTSGYDRLAEWIGDRLSWSGLTVIGLESDEANFDNCKVVTGLVANDKQTAELAGVISKRLTGCSVEYNESFSKKEMEVVLGEKWAEMIQYPSYVRSF